MFLMMMGSFLFVFVSLTTDRFLKSLLQISSLSGSSSAEHSEPSDRQSLLPSVATRRPKINYHAEFDYGTLYIYSRKIINIEHTACE